jgi:hypothetical protein
MSDTLLFLHVLSAAALFAGLAAFSAAALGATLDTGAVKVFAASWRIGILGVFLFGIALAIDLDAYHPWDGWILIAIVLWLVAGGLGDRVVAACTECGGRLPAATARLHWITVAVVILLLADMAWKPWA